MPDLGDQPGEPLFAAPAGRADDDSPELWPGAAPPEADAMTIPPAATDWEPGEDALSPGEAAACRRALEDRPFASELHARLGHVLKHLGDTQGAEAAYLRSFTLDPMQADLLPELAELGWPAAKLAELRAMFDGLGDAPLSSSLQNPGIVVLNDAPPTETATIIVVGVPRSGTSMIAAVLDRLGLFLGERADQAVFEDIDIAAALEHDPTSLADIVARYNAAHPIWGFKRPLAFQKIAQSLHNFRNPRLIMTFRDPLAIALRDTISSNAPLLAAIESSTALTARMARFAQTVPAPVLMVSYEKALADPCRLIESIIRFCGMTPSFEEIERAVEVIGNGPELYLETSRVRFWEGHLDGVGDYANGWARIASDPNPVAVVIKIDGVEVGRGLANRPRPDLARLGKGDVAFSIPLFEKPGPNAKIDAYIDGTDYVLLHSRQS
jgi:hypothetical protein